MKARMLFLLAGAIGVGVVLALVILRRRQARQAPEAKPQVVDEGPTPQSPTTSAPVQG